MRTNSIQIGEEGFRIELDIFDRFHVREVVVTEVEILSDDIVQHERIAVKLRVKEPLTKEFAEIVRNSEHALLYGYFDDGENIYANVPGCIVKDLSVDENAYFVKDTKELEEVGQEFVRRLKERIDKRYKNSVMKYIKEHNQE